MKRMLLVIAVLAIPSFAMAVEHDVRGITLPDSGWNSSFVIQWLRGVRLAR